MSVSLQVELLGGNLTVTSRVNIGSTFTFILPYKVAASDDYSDDQDEFTDQSQPDDRNEGCFEFKPLLGSIYSNGGLVSPVIGGTAGSEGGTLKQLSHTID